MGKASNRILDKNGQFVQFPATEVEKSIKEEHISSDALSSHVKALTEPEQKLKNAPKKPAATYYEQTKSEKEKKARKNIIEKFSDDEIF